MNCGLQDAFNLAWKLALVHQATAHETLLDSYEIERRPAAELVMKSGDEMEKTLNMVEILRELNRSLTGNLHGGFVTCLAMRIHADGAVALANAGHLAPYHNGVEIPMSPSRPLGIIVDAEYTETSLRLTPGDTFTFFSDGVVEAQSPTGELFGFERTGSISRKSAQEIADVAQAFGQEDDITVLTLQFAPA
jgi:serine phosphatase RsbU (regulator of sigma subunit)